jgi:hypothetical protein
MSFSFNRFDILTQEIGIIIYNLLVKIPDFANETSYRKFVTANAYFAKIVPISALVLYYLVVWLSSLFYEEIRLDIERTYKVNQENICRWKCSLVLAGEVVDRINDTFGLILLISITHFFVEFIARSFYLVNSISMTNQPDCITLVSMSSESPFSLVHRLQPHQNSPPGSHLLRIYYSEGNVGQLKFIPLSVSGYSSSEIASQDRQC